MFNTVRDTEYAQRQGGVEFKKRPHASCFLGRIRFVSVIKLVPLLPSYADRNRSPGRPPAVAKKSAGPVGLVGLVACLGLGRVYKLEMQAQLQALEVPAQLASAKRGQRA
jgi:hypothetical protein